MIEDRIIDDKVSLRDLLAQAVCMGVLAGRGETDYAARGPWHIADHILSESAEALGHRERILGYRTMALEIKNAYAQR